MTRNPSITGIGSVTPYGPLMGAIPPRTVQPIPITAWPAASESRAYLVEPFRPLDIVPGLKTRRLDRLSIWSLVAASLAIKDSGVDLDQVDRSRVAVVMTTGLGCIELTEAFFRSAAAHGWSHTDPILFPETLGNAPASHVARHFDLRGPNITISSKGAAAECALLQAASLLRNRQADLALVLAGDTLTRSSYEWYETAGMKFIPSEGVVAMVLEPARSKVRYASLSFLKGEHGSMVPPNAVATGLGDTGALLRIALALSNAAPGARLLLQGGAALLLELP
jgi:3-oxoacyl-(acyl-carrier-protein) synthase